MMISVPPVCICHNMVFAEDGLMGRRVAAQGTERREKTQRVLAVKCLLMVSCPSHS